MSPRCFVFVLFFPYSSSVDSALNLITEAQPTAFQKLLQEDVPLSCIRVFWLVVFFCCWFFWLFFIIIIVVFIVIGGGDFLFGGVVLFFFGGGQSALQSCLSRHKLNWLRQSNFMLIIWAEVKHVIFFHNTALLHNWTGTFTDRKIIYTSTHEVLKEEKLLANEEGMT